MIKKKLLFIDITEKDIDIIMKTLERDVEFLQSSGLMDYSLLLGVEKVNKMNMDDSEPTDTNKTALNSTKQKNNLNLTLDRSLSANYTGTNQKLVQNKLGRAINDMMKLDQPGTIEDSQDNILNISKLVKQKKGPSFSKKIIKSSKEDKPFIDVFSFDDNNL